MDIAPHTDTLRALSRTDIDPRVRHRADGLLLVAKGLTLTDAAHAIGCARNSLRTWGQRFLADGRAGLVDQRRAGRPRKLDDAARELLETALAASPLDDASPVTTWTVADLTDLLGRHGWLVRAATVYRTLHDLDDRYRRPRHDLAHHQDVEAVAAAKHVLAELQQRGLLPGLDSAVSTWMNVPSRPVPTWRRSGDDGESPDASSPAPSSAARSSVPSTTAPAR